MSVDEGHAVRPIEWIQGLDGWQELVDRIKNGGERQKEQVSEEGDDPEAVDQQDEGPEQVEIDCEEWDLGIRKARRMHDPKLPN